MTGWPNAVTRIDTCSDGIISPLRGSKSCFPLYYNNYIASRFRTSLLVPVSTRKWRDRIPPTDRAPSHRLLHALPKPLRGSKSCFPLYYNNYIASRFRTSLLVPVSTRKWRDRIPPTDRAPSHWLLHALPKPRRGEIIIEPSHEFHSNPVGVTQTRHGDNGILE